VRKNRSPPFRCPLLTAAFGWGCRRAAGLHRRLAKVERRSWLATAIRNTVVPASFVAALLGLSGLIMQAVYPDAVSVGGVVHHVLNSSRQQPDER
jgi:hypothetical protein